MFHAGHVDLLHQCKTLAGPDGKVIVGLNTDEFVEQYKGERPVVSYRDRATVVTANKWVDDVFPNDQAEGSINPLLAKIRRNYDADHYILAVGSDWAGRDYTAQVGVDETHLRLLDNTSLVYLERPKDGPSTSKIKAQLTKTVEPDCW